MCGIVGYSGAKNAVQVLLEGLSALEYRGYDSAGVSVFTEKGLQTVKAAAAWQSSPTAGLAPAAGMLRHWPYPLGYPWRAFRRQRASPWNVTVEPGS